jgi:hypothetical protein
VASGEPTDPTLGSVEFLRRLTGKAATISDVPEASNLSEACEMMERPEGTAGKPGMAMRFGQWGGLRVLRDLRVAALG